MLGRALRLRCPWCGGGPLRETWLRLRSNCPQCGLRTERGEEDFFLGAMMFNLVLAEGALAVLIVGFLIAMWPDVPWTFLTYGGIALMLIAPVVFYPLSKTIWLAVDLMLRPPDDEEMEWHRTSDAASFRPQGRR